MLSSCRPQRSFAVPSFSQINSRLYCNYRSHRAAAAPQWKGETEFLARNGVLWLITRTCLCTDVAHVLGKERASRSSASSSFEVIVAKAIWTQRAPYIWGSYDFSRAKDSPDLLLTNAKAVMNVVLLFPSSSHEKSRCIYNRTKFASYERCIAASDRTQCSCLCTADKIVSHVCLSSFLVLLNACS